MISLSIIKNEIYPKFYFSVDVMLSFSVEKRCYAYFNVVVFCFYLHYKNFILHAQLNLTNVEILQMNSFFLFFVFFQFLFLNIKKNTKFDRSFCLHHALFNFDFYYGCDYFNYNNNVSAIL